MLFLFIKVHEYTCILRISFLHKRFGEKNRLPAMIPYVMSATFRECAKYVKAQPVKMKMPPMIIVSRQLNTLIRRLAIGPEWTKTRLINLEIIIIINTKLSPHIYIHYFICLYIEYFELSINIMSSGVCTYIYYLRIRYSRIHNFWFTEFLIILLHYKSKSNYSY